MGREDFSSLERGSTRFRKNYSYVEYIYTYAPPPLLPPPESLITVIELSLSLSLRGAARHRRPRFAWFDWDRLSRHLSRTSLPGCIPPPVHEQAVSPSRFCHSSTGLKMSLIKRAGSGQRNTCARVSHPHSSLVWATHYGAANPYEYP